MYAYAGQILRVDLSSRTVSRLPVSDYAARFVGGRGIAAKLYWDETSPETTAFAPGNCLIFVTGPIAGFLGFSGCRWQICGKSPAMEPEAFSYANLGGSWGSWLKYAGFDGLLVSGKADKPVYLVIGNNQVNIRDAGHLWGKTTVETEGILQSNLGKNARVLSIGPAGENLVTFAGILSSENASGSSGFGAVMGSKNLKAVVIRTDERTRPIAAEPDRLRELASLVRKMRAENFEDYGHILPGSMRLTACYGCISGCTRFTFRAENGRAYKSFCQASGVYAGPAMKYYGAAKAVEANMLAERLCDEYGLDTSALSAMIGWLERCYLKGILSEEDCGLKLSTIGSIEFLRDMVHKLSYREGYGNVLAQGLPRAAKETGEASQQLVSRLGLDRSGEPFDYDPRLILANAISYATEPRRAVHIHHATVLPLKRWLNWTENKWKDAHLTTRILSEIAEEYWGGSKSMDFSTYEGKAMAAKQIQDYAYMKESLILCDLVWPLYQVRDTDERHRFCELESRILGAITGQEWNAERLIKTGERTYNLQRAILARQGWGGRNGDTLPDSLFTEPVESTFFDPECMVPGKNGELISRRGAVIDRAAFEKLKDEYYKLRGWEVSSGLQTKQRLTELGLHDVAEDLDRRGLIGGN